MKQGRSSSSIFDLYNTEVAMDKQDPNKTIIPCEIYTRVSGYFRPLNQFNRGKKEEFRQRSALKIPVEAPKTLS